MSVDVQQHVTRAAATAGPNYQERFLKSGVRDERERARYQLVVRFKNHCSLTDGIERYIRCKEIRAHSHHRYVPPRRQQDAPRGIHPIPKARVELGDSVFLVPGRKNQSLVVCTRVRLMYTLLLREPKLAKAPPDIELQQRTLHNRVVSHPSPVSGTLSLLPPCVYLSISSSLTYSPSQ